MKADTKTFSLNGSSTPQQGGGAAAKPLPTAEIRPKAKRRSFSEAYKRRIVEAAEECSEKGGVGALLRREGLYSSQLATWRKQVASGELSPKKRGRKAQKTAAEKENARLKRDVARLERKLAEAEIIIEAQKKVSELLGLLNQQREETSA